MRQTWNFIGRCLLAPVALLLLVSTFLSLSSTAHAENWPAWRGPRGDGTSAERGLPTNWNAETGENLLWKAEIPGLGHSSPVIWEDQVLLATCLPESEERVLLSIDRRTGKTQWKQTVLRSKLETKHNLNSHASSTPATDGKMIFTAFLKIDGHTVPAPNVGSQRPVTPGEIIVTAFDMTGKQLWQQNVGQFISAHGFCSNPVIYEDLVVINGDHDGKSFIVALERGTGKERWRVKREHGIRSYVTPIIRQIDGRTQMVLSGSQTVVSYEPTTGKQHWSMQGPTEQFVASMVFDGSLMFLTCGYPEHHIVAIRPDGKGDVTDTHIAWRTSRGAAYVPSPVIAGKNLLVVSDNGIASCFDSATGDRHWMERIGKRFSSSAISTADGLAYFVADNGITTVLKPGKEFVKVADNPLGEICSSSPAVSQGCLFIRGEKHLFCIGKQDAK